MRQMFLLLGAMLLLLCPACQREELPEATSAAKELYKRYADRGDLTVALVGDYKGYNAVMLQADDHEGWLRLCEEFGEKPVSEILEKYGVDVDPAVLADPATRVTRMTTQHVSVDSSGFTGSVGSVFTSLIDSLVRVAIDTAYTVTQTKHYEQGVLVDESRDTSYGVSPDRRPEHNRLFQMATAHGDSGYLTYTDSENLALWVFFYSNIDELAQIIDHIISR